MKTRITPWAVVALFVNLLSMLIFALLFETYGSLNSALHFFWAITCTASVILPIVSKYHRSHANSRGKGIEIFALVISFFNCQFFLLFTTSINGTVCLLIGCLFVILYVKLFNNSTPESVPSIGECSASQKSETYYYMEAANGMTVRVPESRLEAWQTEQDRIRNNPDAAKLTETEKQLVDAIVRDIYGSKDAQSAPPPDREISHRAEPIEGFDARIPESLPDSSPQKICRFIWLGVKLFVSHVDPGLILHSHSYLWAAYLYVLAKELRVQAIIDQIYSFFPSEAKNYLGERYRGTESMMIIASSYKRFAAVLNESRIDPRTEGGMQALWYITSRWVFGSNPVPSDAEKHFLSNCKMISAIALTSLKRENEAPATVRYSISESRVLADCTLPE